MNDVGTFVTSSDAESNEHGPTSRVPLAVGQQHHQTKAGEKADVQATVASIVGRTGAHCRTGRLEAYLQQLWVFIRGHQKVIQRGVLKVKILEIVVAVDCKDEVNEDVIATVISPSTALKIRTIL